MTNINTRSIDSQPVAAPTPTSPAVAPARSHRPRKTVLLAAVLVAVVLAPFILSSFWVQLLLLGGASAVGALGLRFLFGVSGQLSLAHAFFIGLGAYGYALLGPEPPGSTTSTLGLPSGLAAVCAILLAGVVGLLFSPIGSRLRGIYLGLATLSLAVFGTHLLGNTKSLGGAYGLDTAPLTIGSLAFSIDTPRFAVLGTPFGTAQILWFLVAVVLVVSFVTMHRIESSRTGRALRAIRDSPAAAASTGIHVQTYRSLAFVVSSLSAGITGVLLALVYEHIVPENFGFMLSILYLAMVILGGPRSAIGSIVGALVVTGLPLVLAQYASSLPFVAQSGQAGGIDPGTLSQYVFGLLLIGVLLLRSTPRGASLSKLVGQGIRRSARPVKDSA